MRLPRLHLDGALASGAEIALPEESAHYARNVLRLDSGAQLRIFGDGHEYAATVSRVGRREFVVVLAEAVPALPESPLAVHLGLALVRGERMDWAVQKATELGAASITPLALARCTARIEESRSGNRLRHWRQVASAAAEQCGRARLPRIAPPATLSAWLAAHPGVPGIVLHTRADARMGGLKPAPRELCLLIGPEGGLEESEVEHAMVAGFTARSLGPRVLRAETAPLAALSILQYLWGDL
jgi:16S rRNA (uracil1498-N3)-methyltransferase